MIKPDYRRERNDESEQMERRFRELEQHRLEKFQQRRMDELHQRSDRAPDEKGSPLFLWVLVGVTLYAFLGAIIYGIFKLCQP